MDSLLASYSSSDEEEEEQQDSKKPQSKQNEPPQCSNPNSANFFSTLPPLKSQSFLSSIPPPKSQTLSPKIELPESESRPKPASLFSLLPQPKTEKTSIVAPHIIEPKPKKIVQFRPPVIPSSIRSTNDGDDDSDDEEKPKRKKSDSSTFETPTVKSFLLSIPAPKNSGGSLGALPSAAGTGRRSILETAVPVPSSSATNAVSGSTEDNSFGYDGYSGLSDYVAGAEVGSGDFMNYDSYGCAESSNLGLGSNNPVNFYTNGADHSSYGPVRGESGDYATYGQFESKWIDRSSEAPGPEISSAGVVGVGAEISHAGVENVIRIGKRGRNEIPLDVIEVKQDELMKNRPREDQAKATGIAFGPSYQPVSAKGKPSKLHKRKHQINTLYFDMRQKEMELAERRSKGFLTKAETQAKYGW